MSEVDKIVSMIKGCSIEELINLKEMCSKRIDGGKTSLIIIMTDLAIEYELNRRNGEKRNEN